MTKQIGINGFGRIGRQVLKAVNQKYQGEIEVVAVNDLFPTETNAHLFKYDSAYGKYPGTVEVDGTDLVVDGKTIKVFSERDPGNLPWGDLGVEVVVESTGVFRDASKDPGPQSHIEKGGAKKVIVSAPGKNVDLTVVIGVNDDKYDHEKHHIISNASCTTNCIAPVVKTINDKFGINKGLLNTIHSYTTSQKVLDLADKDLRRARAAAVNLIPSTTGAAIAVGLVLPELNGKLDGMSIRTPTITGSISDLVLELAQDVTEEQVNAVLKAASENELAGIMGYTEEPLVLQDFVGDDRSSIVDGLLTKVIGGNMVKVLAWYDNEWGYASRTADLAAKLAKFF
ncbi:MAG: type I glyceraldehyde-3-phosphate dehydrogenase [Anaerolineales bacterium]|nr:type I glyceraldehyde-3-phosphate dehydrogenase [Anaerolineales bacterium]